jgi:hypothetical protein
LTIELLGGDAVKDGRYYMIDRKAPGVDAATLAKYLQQQQHELSGIDIVLSTQSVGESHQAVRQLQQMAQDQKLRTLVVPPKDQ